MTRPRTSIAASACGHGSPRWSGRCPACGEWNTVAEEAARPRPRAQPGPSRDPWPPRAVLGRCQRHARCHSDRSASASRCAGADRDRRARPGPGGRAGRRLGDPARRRARRRQVHPRAPGAGERGQQGHDVAAHRGRGVGRAGQAPSRAPRGRRRRLLRVGDDRPRRRRRAPLGSSSLRSSSSTPSRRCPTRPAALRPGRRARCASAQAGSSSTPSRSASRRCSSVTSPRTARSAGPRTLEHLVDTVLSFDGDRHHALRLLSASKHRYGPTGELGLFEMTEAGLQGLADPSALLLGDRRRGVPGSIAVPVIEGRRPLMLEVQGLVGPASGAPRRVAQGIAGGRLALLLAVLERRCHMALAGFGRLRFDGRRAPGERAGGRPRRRVGPGIGRDGDPDPGRRRRLRRGRARRRDPPGSGDRAPPGRGGEARIQACRRADVGAGGAGGARTAESRYPA